MANSSSNLVSHIEAFVDSYQSPAEQAASIDAVTVLVKKNIITLEVLVKEMELYLTTTDNVIRARGILLLAEILSRLTEKPFNKSTTTTLVTFFTARLADWQALRGALVGCLAILRRKSSAGMVTRDEAKLLAQSYLKNVQAQSLAVHDRKLCFELLQCLLDFYPDSVKDLDEDLIYGICDSIDGEKDPHCLLLTFHLVETLVQLFPDPSDSVASFAGDIFEILGCYFPISFTHPRNDDLQIKREDLSRALMQAFCSSSVFEPFAIPLLLEKLSSSLLLAKLDSLRYLRNCISHYGADKMVKHARQIWNALRDIIFEHSSKLPALSASKEVGDEKSQETQMLDETLQCLQTTVSVLDTPNSEIFLDLVLKDKEIEAIFCSITDEGSYLSMSSETREKLKALGYVLSNLLKVSSECCERILQKYLPHVMSILGVDKSSSGKGCTKSFKTSSGSLDFGALYLSVELLTACRDMTVAAHSSSGFVPFGDSWFSLLQDYSGPFVYILGSILETTCNSEGATADIGTENLQYRVKGLRILSTFPVNWSPISDDVWVDILMLLMSVIAERSENLHMWRLALDSLVQIGVFVEEFDGLERRACYNKAVERMVSLLYIDNSTLSLPLKLEAISRIGCTGAGFMSIVIRGLEGAIFEKFQSYVDGDLISAQVLCSFLKCYSNDVLPWCKKMGNFGELAVHFTIAIWNQIENVNADKVEMREQDLVDAVMMVLKVAVGDCTEGSQSLIVEKAYKVLASHLSITLSEFDNSQYASDAVLLSSKDRWLIDLFAAVLVALRPQTYIPDVKLLVKFLAVLSLRGHVTAAQSLASVINKWPLEVSKTSELSSYAEGKTPESSSYSEKDIVQVKSSYALEDIVQVTCDTIFSKICDSSFSAGTERCYDLSENNLELISLVGLAWVGKGLLMRGHERVKDIVMFLLNFILTSSKMSINEQDIYSTVARSAADAFDILLSDSETCLNKTFHAVVKPLYKQRFFASMMPIMLSVIKEANSSRTRTMLCRALGCIISNTPIAAIVSEAKKVVPLLLGSLSSDDILEKDMIYKDLLVLSGVLTDDNGKEAIMENLPAITSCLIKLTSYPHMMVVRETAIQCLGAMTALPHARIYPLRQQVLRASSKALDDKKRAVRQEAIRCHQAWASIASRSLL